MSGDIQNPQTLLDGMIDDRLVVFENPGHQAGNLGPLAARYQREAAAIKEALESVSGYTATPCHRLDRLAQAIGCNQVLLKDESQRFGLGSFKAAGAVYGMLRQLERMLGQPIDPQRAFRRGYEKQLRGCVFATASSGNHGRALAWVAGLVGARCVIYAPEEMSDDRIAAIEGFGATVTRTGLRYNAAMTLCRSDSMRHGWTLFSDTSWPDYRDIPNDIMLGYAHIIAEVATQIEDWSKVTHIVIQGGVGAFAAGLLTGLASVDREAQICPIVVEPREIAALQASARNGEPTPIKIQSMSIMTGISNEEVSVSAWDVLSPRVRWFVGLGDGPVAPCLRYFASGGLDGISIRMGETAAAGISAWQSLFATEQGRALGLNHSGGALVFACEGATDPTIWARIVM